MKLREALIQQAPSLELQRAAQSEIAKLDADVSSLLMLLADIRFAIGDNGKRMQDELVAYCKEIAEKARKFDNPTT